MILDQAAIDGRQSRVVKQVAEELFIDENSASSMLRHYGWKEDKLKREWWDDPEKVRRNVGLVDTSSSSQESALAVSSSASVVPSSSLTLLSSSSAPAPSPDATVQCESAFCERVPIGEATRLNCGHWFCNDCWTGFLISQINDGAKCVFASCMGMRCTLAHNHKFGCACNEKVPSTMFARFVKDPALMAKYTRWVLDTFVEGQRTVKWCPRPGCGRAVCYPSGGAKDITCVCGHRFCFSCLEAAHSPIDCDLVRSWMVKEKSDDATQMWLDARTKACPECNVRIEKNKACNHMHCAKCGHHFCWLCKGPWKSHGGTTGGYYVCNKYNEDISAGRYSSEESKLLANTRSIQKYTYYYNRFKSSQDGIALTKKLGMRLEATIAKATFCGAPAQSGPAKAKSAKNAGATGASGAVGTNSHLSTLSSSSSSSIASLTGGVQAGREQARYDYLDDAIQKLVSARHVLQWTYCMAYYLQAGAKKQLFEYQQEMLIGNTEALQDVMENTEFEALLDKRKEIINKTCALDRFRAEMVKQVEGGKQKERDDISVCLFVCLFYLFVI